MLLFFSEHFSDYFTTLQPIISSYKQMQNLLVWLHFLMYVIYVLQSLLCSSYLFNLQNLFMNIVRFFFINSEQF